MPASPASAAGNPVNTVQFTITGGDPSVRYFPGSGDSTVSVNVPDGDNSRIVFQNANAITMTLISDVSPNPCRQDNPTTVSCAKFVNSNGNLLTVTSASVIGAGGNDRFTASGAGMVYQSTFRPIQVTLSGFQGNDVLTAAGGYSSLVGGPGDDTLTSGPGAPGGFFSDRVAGGAGNDIIDTATNSPDVDGITCDDQADVAPDPDTYLSDSLTRNATDTVFGYFVSPTVSLPSGCDNVTIV